MKKTLHGLLTLFMVLVVQLSFAQEKTITGTVVDEDGLPLPGVNVIEKGTNNGVQTDFEGEFSISVSQSGTLVFSYVGFASQEIKVGSSNTLNVTMAVDAAALGEVVVLGYSTKGVDEVTGSSVQVAGEEIAKSPVVSVEQALQGKVAGVQISQSSGTPGAVQDIRIRGLSSLNAGNDPLFVINGVPVNNSNISGSDSFTSLNPLASINSQDIESITVLKDASATAQYGARGSNGVIVVTTKGGKSGNTTFTFNSQVGFQNDAYNERTPLTGAQRTTLFKESLVNAYGANGTQGDFGFTLENALETAVGFNLVSPAILDYDGTDYDWDGKLTNKDALTQNYSISASGGDEKSNFYASLGYNKTDATVIGADFERINGSISYDRKLRDNIDFSTSVNVSNLKQNPLLENGTFFSNPFITRVLMNPLNNIYNEDGTYNIDLPFGSLPNTLYVYDNNVTRNALTRALVNSNIDWELFKNLTFSNKVSLDYQLNEYFNYRNRYEGDAQNFNGDSEMSDEKNYNLVYQGSLNYLFSFGNHNFDVTTLFEYQKNQNSYLYGYGQNFPVDGLIQINTTSANFDAD
ncbi:MAG: SusC/RagA family TonB-linked outer membrane protein, partial [Flavobacteriaceae bacterium]|nr:SusC/RagA family TonB-linked outer membrane protein [Flavobacteriaceae bacterium]